MSPHELSQLTFNLKDTLEKLGWHKESVTRYHERDWDCSWEEDIYYTKDNKYLFTERNLSETMAYELKSIVDELTELREMRARLLAPTYSSWKM